MKNKLERYAYNIKSPYIIQEGKDLFNQTKGNWNNIFNNNNPILLELGCGNGEYTVNNSEMYKNFNYVGIDIKGSRIWKGAKYLSKINSKNALFLRIQIESILDFFDKEEIDQIFIVFPDPRPKKRDIKKRLTNISFIQKYYQILVRGGMLKLKTDDDNLFDYSIDQINSSKFNDLKKTMDLYNSNNFKEIKIVKTKYENKFLAQGKKIKYLECLKQI